MILPPTWSLPESVRARVSPTTYGRQRAIFEEGHLLLILHKPPEPNVAAREGALFWRNPAGEWQAARATGAGSGALKRHIGEYAALEASLTERIEEAGTTKALFEALEEATPVARAARNLHAALQAARDAVGDDPFLIEMRDLGSDLERNFDLLIEDARNTIQFRTLREAEEQARLGREAVRAGHRLNLIAALFLPATAITSAFGMNLPSGSGGFWAVIVGSLLAGLAVVGWVLARPRV